MPQVQRLADSIEQIVVGAVGLTARALAEGAPDSELTFSQWRALLIVGESDEGVRVGTVASRIGVTPPATSRLLRRLEQRGFISMAVDSNDGRAMLARLSPQGEQSRAAIVEYRRRALRSLARGIAAQERQELARAAELIAAEFGRYR